MDTLKIRLKIARWIAEDLLETLGNEERAQLDAWLAESPEHREEMEDLRRRLLSGERNLPPKEVARRGWEDFMRRRRLVLVRRVMRYAAMIAVPLAVAATVWRLVLPGTEEQPVPVAEPIVAGKTQAVLVLADGRQVDLENVQSLDLREQDGTAISLSDGQVLSYTKEAGVRQLERKIAEICRKAAKEIFEGKKQAVHITERNLHQYLGRELYTYQMANETPEVGIVHQRRRGYPSDRSQHHAWRRRDPAHRSAGRCDEGICPHRDQLYPLSQPGAWH